MESSLLNTVRFIRNQTETIPEALIILGSSLGKVADKIDFNNRIPFQNIPHFTKTRAPTHAGNLVFGRIADKEVMIMQGRYHVYEGFSIADTTYPVCMAAELGVKKLITTNLSGGINEDLNVGDFMTVEDHINLSGVNPLVWDLNKIPGYFTDMYKAYSPYLIRLLENTASELSVPLQKGVLAYLTGPNFETKAELKMLKILGADAVGWSIVPEVLVARRYGMDVLGLACISDTSNPEKYGPIKLKELYEIGLKKADLLFSLLEGLIGKL
jgi:purine-nucleoside phosphorylase